MSQMFKYHVHWAVDGQPGEYLDELVAASAADASQYFNQHKGFNIFLIKVSLVGPADGSPATREPNDGPYQPFDPLMKRRRLDQDEDAR